ncbi:MAG: molecular chaperone DnaK [Alphaproteobacteria bacterium]|nr:molecular chaperone DnaK [Alphaproteobacteria bacterium]HCP01399.1 molecular chaperone DnaK [Rhodospirillaceae bacterium]|tara:strand:- start:212 stop:550 length:339 start_codon:yes stop_codon:yes gene_type:complete
MSEGNDLEKWRAILLAERTALRESSATTADSRKPVTLDQQSVGRLSRMGALQIQAMAKAEEERRTRRLRLISAALSRLDEGEYGYCMTCGFDIPNKRLSVDAAVAQCVDCAK